MITSHIKGIKMADTPTERVTCECFKSGGKMCSPCFMIWYDSGITDAEELFAERQAREAYKAFPFGKEKMPVAVLDEIRERFRKEEAND